MGVEILWFMPITPIGIEGRKRNASELGSYYAVKDYKTVSSEFGTMSDWKSLVKEAHKLGFRVITDWVANHSALDNPWKKSHPSFYVTDSAGKFVSPFDWTDVLKLNYENRELRDSMVSAMKFWITETDIDGFRCDVAGEVPTDFWKDCIGSLKQLKPDLFMLAEAEKPELHAAGFNATYTWDAMRAMEDLYKGKKELVQFDSLINASIKNYPRDAGRMYFTTNHDENSWNGTEFEKYGKAYKTFAVLSQTMAQSLPLMYSGQELPNKKRLEFFVKDPIQWTGKFEMASFYHSLLTLRKTNPALDIDASYKQLLGTGDNNNLFAYIRQKDGHKVLVLLNLGETTTKCKISDKTINGQALNLFKALKEKLSTEQTFTLAPWGYLVYDYQ